MVRILNAYFPVRTLVLGVSETMLIALAFVTATLIWFGSDAGLVLAYEGGLLKIVLMTAVFLLCMYYLDLYDSMVLNSRREVLTRLMQVAGIGTVILAFVYYAAPNVGLSAHVVVTGVVLLLLVLAAWRELFYMLCRAFNLAQRTLVIGQADLAFDLAGELQRRSEAGINLVGFLTSSEPVTEPPSDFPHLGFIERLESVVREHKVERIVIALRDRRGQLPMEPLLALKARGVEIQDGAELYEKVTGKLPVHSLHLSSLLYSPALRLSSRVLVIKRVLSVVTSAALLILTAPLLAIIAIAIRFDSQGPVIFRQKRVGQGGKTFTLYKFRSMFQNASQEDQNRPAEADDPRVTRVGKWLRRTRLDELPQLFNVLIGDIDLVGPRPFVPDQEEECVRHIPFYSQRWIVKPGATGWAQVNRGYCATIEENAEKLSYDLFYIKNVSLGLDALIIFKTLKILLLGRGGR